jgi:hypothetical protein
MAFQLTNQKLVELLTNLEFEPGDLVKNNYRRWRHSDTGCELLLPANKTHESPRPADLVGIKAQLDLRGHLDEDAFNLFVAEGKLPAASAGSD